MPANKSWEHDINFMYHVLGSSCTMYRSLVDTYTIKLNTRSFQLEHLGTEFCGVYISSVIQRLSLSQSQNK